MLLQCGLLGKKLGHSYSPYIHKMLGDYEYRLYERNEHEIEDLLKSTFWTGLNVTMPYKKTVIPFLTSVSGNVKKTCSVNTIIRKANGELFGDNTDVYGFLELIRRSNISVEHKKTLVLGSGGASAAVFAALEELGAEPIVISRSGENNYYNIDRHSDAKIIVNTTPLGMYPATGDSPLDLRRFPECSGVIDIIYNPCRTALLLQAEKLGIPYENGMYMLAAQAKRSSELFTGCNIPDTETDRIFQNLYSSMQNIVLVGMPGSGKSTVAMKIGVITGRPVLDSDIEVKRRTGKSPSQIILDQGEQAFRDIECDILSDFGKRSGTVISTGGGSVLREENYASLHQNGIIVWIRRDISSLPCEDRPLSKKRSLNAMYMEREPYYRQFSDIIVDIDADESISADMILSAILQQNVEVKK